MFCLNGNVLSDFGTQIVFQSNSIILAVSVFACLPVTKLLERKLLATEKKLCYVLVYSLIPVVLLLLSTAALVGNSYNPFIYFQF
jgi:alginate O-acetyltransferase complex protein AlgI